MDKAPPLPPPPPPKAPTFKVQFSQRKKQTVKISVQALQNGIKYINENTTYFPKDLQIDEFYRGLLRAVSTNNIQLFKNLVIEVEENDYDYKGLFKSKNKDGFSLLHLACVNGRGSIIISLIESYGFANEINDSNNNRGYSAFQLAVISFVINGYGIKYLQFLIDNKADLLMTNQKGYNLLEIINFLGVDNEITKWIIDQYQQKYRERSKLMAIWVLMENSINDARFNMLNFRMREQLIQFL